MKYLSIDASATFVPLEIFHVYFSPYSAHAIIYHDEVYPTVEHAYQCARYADKGIRDEIRGQLSPVLAWKVSSSHIAFQKLAFREWSTKLRVMKQLNTQKAIQHEDVRQALIETGELPILKILTTYPPGDGIWDYGEDRKGKNLFGKMWMEIREDLK